MSVCARRGCNTEFVPTRSGHRFCSAVCAKRQWPLDCYRLAMAARRPSKDEAPCCNERRDSICRLPIGYCGPDCVRRP